MKRKIALGLVCLFTLTGGIVCTNTNNVYAEVIGGGKGEDFVAYPNHITVSGIENGKFIEGYPTGKVNNGLICIKISKNTAADSSPEYNPVYSYGYIDTQGKLVIPDKYEDATDFENGIAAVKLNGKWGVIDVDGKQIVPFKYDEAYYFNNGLLSCSLNGKWGAIDKTGKIVIPFEYDDLYLKSEDLIGFKKNGKYGFIDTNNKVIIQNKYEDVINFSEGIGGYKLNGKWGILDKTGKEIIKPTYDTLSMTSEGKLAVSLNGKYGFIDKTGKIVIDLQYEKAYNFSEGRAAVGKTRRVYTGYVDENNLDKFDDYIKYQINFAENNAEYAYIGITDVDKKVDLIDSEGNDVSEDFMFDMLLYGFIDENGNQVIPYKYSGFTQFFGGLAGVELFYEGPASTAFYIDKNGKVKNLGLDNICEFSEGLSFSHALNRPDKIIITKNMNYTTEQQTASPTQNNNQITVNLNGKKIEFSQSPIVENGYTLVPMRNIFEALGAEVSWDQATRTVTAKKDDKEMKITVDSKVAKVNGSEYQLDVPARNINGSVLVPLRFIGEQLGVDVKWDGSTKTVTLTTNY